MIKYFLTVEFHCLFSREARQVWTNVSVTYRKPLYPSDRYFNPDIMHSSICYSLWPLDVPEKHLRIWAGVFTFLSFLTIAVNSLLLLALCRTGEIQSLTTKFVAAICISDSCTGLIVLPMIVMMLKDRSREGFRSCEFRMATQYLAYVFGYFSFFMLIIIAADRYFHLTRLFRYRRFMTTRRMKELFVLTFIMSNALSVILLYVQSFYFQLILTFSNIVAILSIYIMYIRILKTIQVYPSSLDQTSMPNNRESFQRKRHRDLAVLKTVQILLGTIFFLYNPYNVLTCTWTFERFHKNELPGALHSILLFWSYVLIFSNPVANAVIYSYGNGRVRKYICKTLWTIFCCESSTMVMNLPITIISSKCKEQIRRNKNINVRQ